MLKINGDDWKIYLVSPDHPQLERSDGTFTIGACNNLLKAIFLNENLKAKMMKKVLCHELAHAAMFSYNVILSLEQEELLADLMATYGQEIIFTTNKIFNRLTEEKEKGESK